MSFTDQKQRVATEEHLKARWRCAPPGERFRCFLCGHKFKLGDLWRFLISNTHGNFMVCDDCDGPDIMERWKKHVEEGKRRFWWMQPNSDEH